MTKPVIQWHKFRSEQQIYCGKRLPERIVLISGIPLPAACVAQSCYNEKLQENDDAHEV